MNFNYISLDLIIERLNTNKLPGQEWNISELKEWTWEALSKMNVVQEFIEESLEIEIIDGKGEIPSNIHSLHSVLEGVSGYNMSEIDSFDEFGVLTYKINAGYIFTSFDKGTVILNCFIFPVDEDNRPLVPNNEYYISAVYSFIRMKLGERLMWQNKILFNQYQFLEREWFFYCPAATNSTKMPKVDQMESIQKVILKPLPNLYRNKGRNKSFINFR